jgi:hypothetical protein
LPGLALLSPTGEPPLPFVVACYSIALMILVLASCWITYCFRRAIERTERLIQGFKQKTYTTYIQAPAAAVILAAIGGYGVNSMTGGATGALGYAGFLMALPIPLALVFFSGVRQARDAEFKERWPPSSLVPTDRVQVRYVIERASVEAESASPNHPHVETAIDILLDKTLPAIRERANRSLRKWLRDHRYGAITGLLWSAGTVCCGVLAVLPNLRNGEWALLRVPIMIALVVVVVRLGTAVVLWRHSQFKYRSLAQQVESAAGGLRRRRTKEKLGIRP